MMSWEKYVDGKRPPKKPKLEFKDRPSFRPFNLSSFGLDSVAAERQLHICSECDSDLVQLEEQGEHKSIGTIVNGNQPMWDLTLSCPNCNHEEQGIFTEDQLQTVQENMQLGTHSIIRDIEVLTKDNMAQYVELLASALQNGHIVPEDF